MSILRYCSFSSFIPDSVSSFVPPLYLAQTFIIVCVPFLGPMALWAILCLCFALLRVVGSLAAVGANFSGSRVGSSTVGFSSVCQWNTLAGSPKGRIENVRAFLLRLRLLYLQELYFLHDAGSHLAGLPRFVSAKWFWLLCFLVMEWLPSLVNLWFT